MCRIAGTVGTKTSVNWMTSAVESMCNAQKHGGPDDGGIFVSQSEKVVLGNRRLSFLDLSNEGHMPMSYADRYTITYNGEIYNFKELREELSALGHEFKSRSDTEVILAAYAQWGVLSFPKLKGMFAFALWDEQKQDLFLVRDASGIKPLYYHVQQDFLCFASEIRAFREMGFGFKENPNWPVYFLAYGHIPEPVTSLNEVRPLEKGFFLHYNVQSKKISRQSFAHYSYSERITDRQEALNLVRESTFQSVGRHLLADAPIGVFLSGGLDSGIIASVASAVTKQPVNTLSIYFNEPEFSEKKYQDLMIRQLNCEHHQLLLSRQEFDDSFPDIIESMDMPSSDGVNTWFISKYARLNGLKAVLSGLGGDELFGGYPSFSRTGKSRLLQHFPNPLLGAGKYTQSKRLNRMSYLQMDGIKGIYLFLRGHFTPHEIAKQLGNSEKEVWQLLNEMPVVQTPGLLRDGNQASWMEYNLYMQNQLLRDADVMSMIHSVEIRVPFLDDDLVRTANRISPEIKFSGKRPKQFLIDCFEDMIPNEIWNRSKMGFSFPFEKWLKESAGVADNMRSASESTRKNHQKFMQGKLHWSQLISLIILQHRNII